MPDNGVDVATCACTVATGQLFLAQGIQELEHFHLRAKCRSITFAVLVSLTAALIRRNSWNCWFCCATNALTLRSTSTRFLQIRHFDDDDINDE